MDVRPSLLVPGALGAFAVANVKAGETILVESALVLSAARIGVRNMEHNSRFAWSVVDELLGKKDISVAAFYINLLNDRYASGIADHIWEDGDTRALKALAAKHIYPPALVRNLYDIFATNVLAASTYRQHLTGPVVLEMANRYGFYRLLSRVNHSCDPNATTVPQASPREDAVLKLVATRAIATDEEITINYLGPQRQSRTELFATFGFRCACPACKRLCSYLECSATVLKACPCQRAAYCSTEHQRKDWPRHRATEHVKLQ